MIKKILFSLIFSFCIIKFSNAVTRYSVAAGGNWNSTATWSTVCGGAGGSSVPVAGDIVFICGSAVNISGANANCATLTINSGAILTWPTGNVGKYTLTVSGVTTVNGTITIVNSGGSAVNSTLECNGGVTINSGGLITNNGEFNMANSSTFIINNGGVYNHNPRVNNAVNETMFNRTGATNTFDVSSTIIINGWTSAATSLGQYAPAFGNITFSPGLVWNQSGSFSPNKIKGNVLITNGQINFDEGAGGTTALTINGSVTTSGSGGVIFAQGANRNLTLTTGMFTHNGTGLASIMYQTYGNLSYTCNGNFNVSFDFTLVQGTGSNVASSSVQVNGDANISGGFFDFNRAVNAPLTLNVTGNINISGAPGWMRFIDSNAGTLNVTCTNLNISGGTANNFYYGAASTGTSNWTITNNVSISGTHTTNFSLGLGSVTMAIGNDINVSSTSTSWPYFINNSGSSAAVNVTVARDINITGAGLLRGAFSQGIVNLNVNRNLNMLSSSDITGQRLTSATAATTFTVAGSVLINNPTANFNGTLSNGNFNLRVTENITLTNGTLHGVENGNGNVVITTTNFRQSAGFSRFIYSTTPVTGSVTFTASGDWNHNGGQHVGLSNAFNGNNGTVTYSMNNLIHTAGSIIYHSSAITDGRTCSVAILGNASFSLTTGSDFCIFNNISNFTTNNAIYTLSIGGNLSVSGSGGALITRWTNTGDDNVYIAGNMTLSGATTTFAGGFPANMPNNKLDCRIGGNVSITGAANFYTQSSNNTSKIDLNLGTASVTWAQTTSGTVSLTNTNVKTGKALFLTGNKMGDLQIGRTATVETGATLWCSNFPVTGAGMFMLSSGAKIGSGSVAGLTSAGATGNIQVAGTRTYNSNATYEYYEGLTPQATGNFITTTTNATYPSQVSNLIINKTLGANIVNLTNTTDIVNNGTLTLTNGVLTTSYTAATAPWIRIPNNSTTVSPTGGSASSYIDGYIRKTGTGNFIFPTGNAGKWRRIETNSLSSSTEFEARYISTIYPNTTALAAVPVIMLDHVSKTEFWMLNKPLGLDAVTAKVKLYWENASMSSILKFDSLAVGRWNGSEWENTNCYSTCPANWTSSTAERTYTGAASGAGAGTIQSNTVSTFGPFTFASIGITALNPLPVKLLYFNALCKDRKVHITWATASQINNDYFTIERSTDRINWQVVGKIDGAGNSNHTTDHSFIDEEPLTDISYYRLKQTDLDGKFEYFDIVAITCRAKNFQNIKIYPNPASDKINIEFTLGNSAMLTVFNLFGQEIIKEKINSNKTLIDIADLPKGIYLFTITQDEKVFSKKIVTL